MIGDAQEDVNEIYKKLEIGHHKAVFNGFSGSKPDYYKNTLDK
jgi:hypothetical protein